MAQYGGITLKHIRYNDCPDDYISATIHHSLDDARLLVTANSDNGVQNLFGVQVSTLKLLVSEAEKYEAYIKPIPLDASIDTIHIDDKEYTPDGGKNTFEVTITTSNYTTTDYASYVLDVSTGLFVEAICADTVVLADEGKAQIAFDEILGRLHSKKALFIEGQIEEELILGTDTFLELYRVYPNKRRCLIRVSCF